MSAAQSATSEREYKQTGAYVIGLVVGGLMGYLTPYLLVFWTLINVGILAWAWRRWRHSDLP